MLIDIIKAISQTRLLFYVYLRTVSSNKGESSKKYNYEYKYHWYEFQAEFFKIMFSFIV